MNVCMNVKNIYIYTHNYLYKYTYIHIPFHIYSIWTIFVCILSTHDNVGTCNDDKELHTYFSVYLYIYICFFFHFIYIHMCICLFIYIFSNYIRVHIYTIWSYICAYVQWIHMIIYAHAMKIKCPTPVLPQTFRDHSTDLLWHLACSL
jgi:hypothetical protein